MAGLQKPSRASGPQSAAWVTASLSGWSREASQDSRASVLLQGHSPIPLANPRALRSWSVLRSLVPLLRPAPEGAPGHGSLGPSPTLCPSSSGVRRSLSAAQSPHLHRRPALRPSWHRHGGAGQRGGAGWRLGPSGRWPRARAVGQAECGGSPARGQGTGGSTGAPAPAPPRHGARHPGVWARLQAAVSRHSPLPRRVPALRDSGSAVPGCGRLQPPRLLLRPRQPRHRQSPPQPVATRRHGPAWRSAVRGPLLPSAARSQRGRSGGSRGCSTPGRAASPQAGGDFTPRNSDPSTRRAREQPSPPRCTAPPATIAPLPRSAEDAVQQRADPRAPWPVPA